MQRVLLVVLLAGGCAARSCDGSDRESAAAESADPPATIAALRAVKRDMTLAREADSTAATNLHSNTEALEKARRQERQTELVDRIPDEPLEPGRFERELHESAVAAGVIIKNLAVDVRAASPAPLPEIVHDAWTWQPDPLRTVCDVRFRLEALSAAGFTRWYAYLPEALPRLLWIEKLVEMPGGWDVHGEVYSFREVRVPRHVPLVLPAADRLEAAGVDRESVASDPGRALLRETEALEAELRRLQPAVEKALAPLAQAHWLAARFAFFRERISAVRSTSAKALLDSAR